MTSIEEWRPVVGWEGMYEVSSLGRVRSLPRYKTRGRILRTTATPAGYWFVGLSQQPVRREIRLVHRLVAEAFLGPLPPGMQTRHLDGVATNNALTNLAYGTPKENHRDTREHGHNTNLNKTHCPAGHPYDEANTRVSKRGGRLCRMCSRDRHRQIRALLRS